MTTPEQTLRNPGLLRPHGLEAAEVFAALQTDESGLQSDKAQLRLQSFGKNELPMAPPRPAWLRFLSQFNNVLIFLLLGSGLISLLLQHMVDAGVIFAVVLINGIVGFIQEGRAEAALRSILSMTRTRCRVVRDGMVAEMDSDTLVPGDVVLLKAGDRVPADVRLFYVKALLCDESALTGESQPVEKQVTVMDPDSELAERVNMGYMGTMVTAGTGRGVVCHTGIQTQIGSINTMVQQVRMPVTPLQLQLQRFAGQLTIAILVLSVLIMMFGVFFRDYAFADMMQAAIGIAVASIPEAIPAVVTITLAIGVMRMARKKALVRRLPAVEVLGSVDVICSDKTGTLTTNNMTVREVVTASGSYRVEGSAQSTRVSPGSTEDGELSAAARVALLCNDATVATGGQMQGAPTETALLAFAINSGLRPDEEQQAHPRQDQIPFDAEHRFMATQHSAGQGNHWLAVKGAPEQVLEACATQLSNGSRLAVDTGYWQERIETLGQQGMRVIALAMKDTDPGFHLSHEQVLNNLTLVGLAGISDPPRKEAVSAIARCHDAGIRVKMITGDNPITAAAIGRELGINSDSVMTGRQLAMLNDQQLALAVEEVDVFARTSPANKLQLVQALQLGGRVVAMTGDGVNDSPALRKANIGIAMGERGTDAAREASDFVLMDDNFANIAEAVAEGRTVFDNIHKSIVFILPTSMAEAAVITAAILMGLVLPITPAQVLWVNMTTAITLSLALVFEASEANVMQRPPRDSGRSIITLAMLLRLVLVAGSGALIVFLLFRYYLNQGASIEYARAISVTALVFIESFYLLNCRFLYHSIFNRRMLQNLGPVVGAITAVMVLQLGFCYLPVMQNLFGIAAIAPVDWLLIALATSTIVLIVEVEKALTNRFLHMTR